jgi:phage terminase large subunit-like protein
MQELDELPPKVQLARLLEEKARRMTRRKLFTYYPDRGALRRELYPKHQAFLAAGAKHRIRMMMAANRVGKSEGCGLYETTLHMTGRYPAWWQGKRFNRPVRVWVCGDTGKTLREILQVKLLGPWGAFGTGLIPGDDLVEWKSKQGVAESIDTFTVRHINGGTSHGVFKSYDQGRDAFAGSEQDVILLDEECSLEVYGECLLRTMTTGGIVMLTFTPLGGVTKLIKHMRESNVFEIGATWDDVPHLAKEAKDELWAATPEYMREARAKGIPARGSGVVFPVSEQKITCESFSPVPAHWPRIGGLDFGWDHPSAAVCTAHNTEDDIFYVIGTHKQREASPLTFASGVKPWGNWLPWAWPHDGLQCNRDAAGGRALSQLYADEGMNMLEKPASFSDDKLENAVEPGIMEILNYMQSGRFYVMAHLADWFAEFRDYYRKEGVIVKEDDDLISATRYAFMMRRFARCKPRMKRDVPARPLSWRTM